MNRIYCKDCVYLFLPFYWYSIPTIFTMGVDYIKDDTTCTHPKNGEIKEHIGDFFSGEEKVVRLLKPSEINKDNDCPLFEEGEHFGNVALRNLYISCGVDVDEIDRINS